MAPDLGLLLDSIDFAAKKHKNQRRKVSSEHITINQKDIDQTPYINHPIGVCHILYFEAGCSDISTLISAVLHDTVEDTETTFEEIETSFGSKVMNIVQENVKGMSECLLNRLQIEHALQTSPEAKLADKIYNLRDLNRTVPVGWTEERVQAYFEWSKKVTDNLKGSNEIMDKILDVMYGGRNL